MKGAAATRLRSQAQRSLLIFIIAGKERRAVSVVAHLRADGLGVMETAKGGRTLFGSKRSAL